MDSNDKAWMKGEEAIVSFLLEDVAQVIMQYYYFEKFNFLPTDAFTYFNAGFMIFTASEFLVRMIIMLYGSIKSQNYRDIQNDSIFFILVIFLNIFPISRAWGAFRQSSYGNGMVNVSL